MFIGHYAVAFAAKRVAPRTSLGTLFLAAQLLDLLWPVFLLTGVERVRVSPGNTAVTPLAFTHYPYSHSLLMSAVWAGLFAVVYQLSRHYRRGALVVGAAVLSHWVLDLFVHRPDLPLYPGGAARLGLGLWNSVAWTVLVESFMLAAGFALYLRATRARDRAGSYGLWALVAFLVLIYAANLLGPPPPDQRTIALADLGQWLLVLWGFWVDRHRTPHTS
jgi:membrane-bound metal-dependent hydrolase YbcI (DUF457 family)